MAKSFNRHNYYRKPIKRAYSKDNLAAYSTSKTSASVFPNFSFIEVKQLIDQDPVARGALIHFVDKCMEGNRSVVKRDTYEYDATTERTLEENFMFRRDIERKNYLLAKLYNNVFIEIVRGLEGRTIGLNVLDSNNIEPQTAPNGDLLGFTSKIDNPITGKTPTWDTKDIVWIKYGDRSEGYAPVDIKAVYENLVMKYWIKRYVAWLWQTGQYRVIYGIKSASDQSIEDFLAYEHRHTDDFKAPFILKGEFETKILRDIKETSSITDLLKYLDSQTLILLRISPIDAGIPDASGRSNADAQSNNVNTHIASWKKIFQDSVNYDLFPKISKANSLWIYAPIDRFEEKMVLENVQLMKSCGFTNEACKEYLLDKGLIWETSKLFEDVINPLDNPRNLDNAPSRQGKATGAANDKVGTGSQSTSRPDQVGGQ